MIICGKTIHLLSVPKTEFAICGRNAGTSVYVTQETAEEISSTILASTVICSLIPNTS
jgi:hypothetical protein